GSGRQGEVCVHRGSRADAIRVPDGPRDRDIGKALRWQMKNWLGWLCKSMTAMALLTAIVVGCGSTAHDRLVFRFVRWDGEGITQEDSVGESSADVDVVQDCCTFNPDGSCATFEPITQTTINAIFSNEEASDIRLESYTVHVEDPN